VGILWRPGKLEDLGHESGVTAFDTGGLWFEHIKTDPPLSQPAERAAFTQSMRRDGAELEALFSSWLINAYPDDAVAYLFGRVPHVHVPQIILDEKVNQPRAWSWEMRIDSRSVSSMILAPSDIYWMEEDYEAFEAWIQEEDDVLSVREKSSLLAHCKSLSTFTPQPKTAIFEKLRETLT
jgi:hypothetical protein